MDEEMTGAAPQADAENAGAAQSTPENNAPARIGAKDPAQATPDPAEERLRAHFTNLQAQANAMRQMYPGFDLNAELKDPAFFRWTAPEGGMTLKQAYMARHGDEMLADAMRYAAERTREHTMANVRAGMARPREGGLSGTGGAMIDRDIASLTRGERADIKQRAARGEKIVF